MSIKEKVEGAEGEVKRKLVVNVKAWKLCKRRKRRRGRRRIESHKSR